MSKEVFSALDDHLWQLTYRWALRSHPNKPKHWVVDRYFGRVQPVQARQLGVRRPRQRRLPAPVRLDEDRPAPAGQGHGITRRPRPGPVLGRAATQERPAGRPHPAPAAVRSTDAARSAARSCSTPTGPQTPREWEQWITGPPEGDPQATHRRRAQPRRTTGPRTASSTPTADRQTTAAEQVQHVYQPGRPRGLLEPDAVKRARPVLRGPGRSNGLRLPDRVFMASPPRSMIPTSCRAPGLAPVLALAERAGLHRLVAEHVRIDRAGGGERRI